MSKLLNSWSLYIVRCSDDTLYTGISNDVTKRVAKHNSGKGAKYTRSRYPVELVASWIIGTRSLASKAEYIFKSLSKKDKEYYVENNSTMNILMKLEMEINS